ncbi:hypothetical protein BJX61DRAFT_541576 [Aspergillus egyptiacus]|nr:hypothetical protein BJX61DRAFT_541576 [Aspergillus egyptiacus]
MSDTVDLLGLAGTWLAAILALVALAGVIPAYILYRESQSGHYEALSLIDDPSHEYISKGYVLLPGKQFFRTVRVPNLTMPPRVMAEAENPPLLQLRIQRKCDLLDREGSPSLTAWINFANLLRAYSICPPLTGKIKVSGKESLLPVHRSWILLLGLVDRYGRREDCGLFEGEALEPEWSDLDGDMLYGLSGILQSNRPMRSRIDFRMHNITHMAKMPSVMPADDLSLQTLFFLFLGYLPAADGSLLCSELESDETSSSKMTRFVPKSTDTRTNFFYKLRTLEPNEIPLRHRRLAGELGIRLPRIRQVSLHRTHRVDENPTNSRHSGQAHGELDGVQYQRIDRTADNIKVWIDPSDSKTMVLSLLRLDMNTHSFLCDDDLSEFFERLLQSRNNNYLEYLADGGTDMLQIKKEEETLLKNAISEVLQYELSSMRSRRLASALTALEGLVKRLVEAYQIPPWAMQTMAVLYFLGPEFISRLLCRPSHVDPEAMFAIDVAGKRVRVPALSIYPETHFEFDFAVVFKVPPVGEECPTDTSLPLWKVMLAALYGDIKWQMWSTVFSAGDFASFYARLDRIVYIPGQNSLDDQDSPAGHMRDVASACQEITGLLRDLHADHARPKRNRRSRHRSLRFDEEEIELDSDWSSDESGGKEDSGAYGERSRATSMSKKLESISSRQSRDGRYGWHDQNRRPNWPLNYEPIRADDLPPRPQRASSYLALVDKSILATAASEGPQVSYQKPPLSLLSPPPQQKEYFPGLQEAVLAPPDAAGLDEDWTRDNDKVEKHKVIAAKCIELLSGPGILVQNMCHLESPGSARIDINSQDVAVALPPHVQYACRYWVYHLGHGECTLTDEGQVTAFLKCHLLHWLEGLALVGCIFESIAMIKTLLSLVDPSSLYVLPFLTDVLRFVQKIARIVDTAPLQLYSAIIWLPESSITRRIYLHQVSSSMPQLPRVQPQWSAVHLTLEEPDGTQLRSTASLAFSSDGGLLASGDTVGAIKVWDTETGQLLRTMATDHDHEIDAVVFSPDGRLLASATSGGGVQVYESRSGTKLYDLEFHNTTTDIRYPPAVAYSRDGTVLAVGGGNGVITLWDLTSGNLKRSLEGHTEAVMAVSFSEDGLLASGSIDKTARLWNPELGQLLRTFEGFSTPVWMVGFASHGHLLMGLRDGGVKTWDMREGGTVETLTTPSRDVYHYKSIRPCLSSSGRLLAVPAQETVELSDALSGKRTHVLRGSFSEVQAVALTPDDTFIAVARLGQTSIEVRELSHESAIDSLAPLYQPGNLMEFSPDGRLLASGGDERLDLWDAATGRNIHTYKDDGGWVTNHVSTVIFSPDSRWLVFAAGPNRYKWDISRGLGGIHPIPSTGLGGLRFAFSPDSKVLAQEISATRSVQLWALETLESLHAFPVLHAVGDMAFSPDNKSFACGLLSGHIQRWDLDTETPHPTLTHQAGMVTKVAFSSDSKLLASLTDREVIVWDWATGSALRTFTRDAEVTELSFCNEDNFLRTDQEVFSVNDSSAAPPAENQPRFGLSLDGSWITRNGRNFLWLPPEYRAVALARYESRLALTLETGPVVFIGLTDPAAR